MSECVAVEADSTYTLPNAPRGKYDIVFILKKIANYLPVQVSSGGDDKFYLRDLVFSESPQLNLPGVTTYSGSLEISNLIVPKEYLNSETPSWYMGKTFDKILYYNFVNGSYIEVATENPALWPYSKRITINNGVPLQGLINFPYLVRLSGKNFDFSQASVMGNDIRFSRNGKFIPFQIERWDSLNTLNSLHSIGDIFHTAIFRFET